MALFFFYSLCVFLKKRKQALRACGAKRRRREFFHVFQSLFWIGQLIALRPISNFIAVGAAVIQHTPEARHPTLLHQRFGWPWSQQRQSQLRPSTAPMP